MNQIHQSTLCLGGTAVRDKAGTPYFLEQWYPLPVPVGILPEVIAGPSRVHDADWPVLPTDTHWMVRKPLPPLPPLPPKQLSPEQCGKFCA